MREQTSWNLSQLKINLIGNLIQEATYGAVRNNYIKFFDCWRQIALIIDNRIEPEERLQVELLEKNVYVNGVKTISEEENPNLLEDERTKPRPTVFKFLTEKYAKYVNSLLKKVGLDIKEIDTSEEEAY